MRSRPSWTRPSPARRRIELKEFLVGSFGSHPCVDCGATDIRVLDFDHRPGSGKRKDVMRMVKEGFGLEAIRAEIDKCAADDLDVVHHPVLARSGDVEVAALDRGVHAGDVSGLDLARDDVVREDLRQHGTVGLQRVERGRVDLRERVVDGGEHRELDRTFELWFVRGDEPVPAGTFDADGGAATAELTGTMQPGDTIAVTVEPAGGSPSGAPTTAPIIAIPTV